MPLLSIFSEIWIPMAFKIDGMGEHEPRVLRDHSWSEKILDLVLRLLFYPAIDRFPGGFGVSPEIKLYEAPLII